MMDSPARVAQFVDLFARHQSEALIANLSTRVEQLEIGGLSVPMTVNDGGLNGNCYICDPVTGYVDYAIEETRNFVSRPLLQRALIGLIHSASAFVRATGLDRSVQVNNWLFSTNPVAQIDRPAAAALRDHLTARFPTHAIILRSLNTYADAPTLGAFQAEGFHLIPSRQVYVFDGRTAPGPGRDMKNDRRLLQKTRYELVTNEAFEPRDYARCAELYRLLYLEKYTPLNPQYTPAFIAEMHQAGLIELEGLRGKDRELAAFGGRFQIGHTLTQPLLGYDTSRPQKDGLYRLITALAQLAALEHGLLFNMSAGAAGFKRHRGAVPAIEYSAVYVRHLPRRQRMALRAIEGVLSGVGVPLLQRFEL
jgi:hypothetical protein